MKGWRGYKERRFWGYDEGFMERRGSDKEGEKRVFTFVF